MHAAAEKQPQLGHWRPLLPCLVCCFCSTSLLHTGLGALPLAQSQTVGPGPLMSYPWKIPQRVKLLGLWHCRWFATPGYKQIFAGELKGRFTEAMFWNITGRKQWNYHKMEFHAPSKPPPETMDWQTACNGKQECKFHNQSSHTYH